MKNKQINNVCEPIKPRKAEAKAMKCLAVMLDGGVINRKTLGSLKISAFNDSAHSLVSILRNERFIPIESLRQADGTSDYFIQQEEIKRYKDPTLRSQQREDMRKLVEEKRQKRVNALLAKRKGGI